MKPTTDVYTRLQDRLIYEAQNLRSVRKQMQELAPAYNRYLDLDNELDSRRHRMSIILGLLGPERVTEIVKADNTASLGEALEQQKPLSELREKLRLWRAVREYVRMAGTSRIADIHQFLEWAGLKDVTRQAIESALKQHEDTFETTKRGHERFVALKRTAHSRKKKARPGLKPRIDRTLD
jgi:hypothetical protein